MSLNFENHGAILATVKDNPSLDKKFISVSTSKTSESGDLTFPAIQLSAGQFQPVPNFNSERSVNYIVGASGSGKSYYIKQWIKEYKKKYKKNGIYLFSALSEDETLDEVKPQRVCLDDAFVKDKIDLEMFSNSLVIFDDTDSIANKPLKIKVYDYLKQFLNLGRHFNISLYVVNHTPTGTRAESKSILNECHTITFFPANWNRQLVYLLQNYAGLDTKALQKVKNMESRWITIYRHYPQVLMNESEIMMMKLLNSD